MGADFRIQRVDSLPQRAWAHDGVRERTDTGERRQPRDEEAGPEPDEAGEELVELGTYEPDGHGHAHMTGGTVAPRSRFDVSA